VYAEGAGIARCLPRAVAVPTDAVDVQRLVAWAARTATPLVPRGSGSGMAGGAVGPGVIVDLSRLNEIEPVDRAERRVWIGPGALRGAVEAAARTVGLTFPPDPSSGAFCTVGGMASTNAAGAHALRYGATRPWIAALDCVFADGTRALVRRGAPAPDLPAVRRFLADVAPAVRARGAAARHDVRKDSSGYAVADYAASEELVDLLVGSEGTLVLFVGLELALASAPAATSSVLAAFATLEGAVLGAALARDAGASACELLDRTFLDVARSGGDASLPDIPSDVESVLLVEFEGDSAVAARMAADRLSSAYVAAGARDVRVALDAESEHALWALRHAASPILARLDPSLKSMQFIEDAAVPPARLPDYVRGVRAALDRQQMRGVIFGHAGDGNVHVNPLVDVSAADWRGRVRALLDEVTALVARLGGTLAGEHGDGRLRTPLLDQTWDADARALFAAVKDAFDPTGILNPGVKVALPSQPPLADIKYDPDLPALPAAARGVLDRVADKREYARFRLDMLDGSGRAERGAGSGADVSAPAAD
jgi:FAD/FMN-containing dehydrogenase